MKNLFRKKDIHQLLKQVEAGQNEEGHGSLGKHLGVRDLAAFGIAAIIGAGIFSTIGKASFDGGPAVIFLFIFCLINKWKNIILSFHFKIIWIVKSFFSFFLIMLYEQEEGLDQMNYFYLVINNITWTWHFGNLDNLIDINNTTVNFLLFMKAINFIFDQSWFMQKLFQNLIQLGLLK